MSAELEPLRCEAGECPEIARWTIEREGELRMLCDRHYAVWPVEGNMFRRAMLARAWHWPEPAVPASVGDEGD